ncbi:MAG: hypothetical protein ACTHMT_12365, partial [Verrucomicrobiota bacterium]
MPKSKPLSTKALSQNDSPASPAPSPGGNGEIHSALTRLNAGLGQQQDALTAGTAETNHLATSLKETANQAQAVATATEEIVSSMNEMA